MLSNLCSSQRKGPGTWLSLAVWVVYSNQETEGWTPHLRGWGKVTEAPPPSICPQTWAGGSNRGEASVVTEVALSPMIKS